MEETLRNGNKKRAKMRYISLAPPADRIVVPGGADGQAELCEKQFAFCGISCRSAFLGISQPCSSHLLDNVTRYKNF